MPALVFSLASTTNLGNPGTLTAPNPPNPGGLMVATVKVSGTVGSVTIPNFTAATPMQVGNSTSYLIPLKLAVASEQTATITATDAGTPTVLQMNLGEFWGVSTTEDAALVSTNGGATNLTTQATGSITTTSPLCLLVAYLGLNTTNTATSITIDSGFTLLGRSSQCATAYRFVAPGSYDPTWTWPTASRATTAIQAFRATPSQAGFLPIGA